MNDAAALDAELASWRKRLGTPLVEAAISLDGALIWAGASSDDGDVLAGEPGHRRFCIYSINKTLTAICVLRLAEAGRIELAGALTTWLPAAERLPHATIGELLTHTGGMPDYGGVQEYHAAVRRRPSEPWTDEEFLACARATAPPGKGEWRYSNIGYLLLRRAIEAASGLTYGEAIAAHVVAPLGLTGTFVATRIDDWRTCVPGWTTELTSDRSVTDMRGVYHPGWCAPGVVVSTAAEVTLIYDALFAGRLISCASLEQLNELVRVPGEHPPFVSPSYGMGIMGDPDSPNGPIYGHGGGGPGFSLTASIVPASPRGRVGIAVFCNTGGARQLVECERALLAVLDRMPVEWWQNRTS